MMAPYLFSPSEETLLDVFLLLFFSCFLCSSCSGFSTWQFGGDGMMSSCHMSLLGCHIFAAVGGEAGHGVGEHAVMHRLQLW